MTLHKQCDVQCQRCRVNWIPTEYLVNCKIQNKCIGTISYHYYYYPYSYTISTFDVTCIVVETLYKMCTRVAQWAMFLLHTFYELKFLAY